jgi:hypothetical protein
MALAAHLLNIVHGLAAAFVCLGVLYAAGLLLTPSRWERSMRWPDSVVLGLTCYVVLCSIAISSRGIPLKYIALVFAALLWALASLRGGLLQTTLLTRIRTQAVRWWMLAFCALYVFAYLLIRPAAGSSLPLGTGDNISLVTYATYARHVVELGTPHVDRAAFDYQLSPASVYVLGWQSLMFGRDPLDAAMPTLFLLAALFGAIAAEICRVVFGLSGRAALAIACIALCAPIFRSLLGAFAIAELLAAVSMLYVLRAAATAVKRPLYAVPATIGAIAGVILLMFATPPWAGWGSGIVGGFSDVVSKAHIFSLLGLPLTAPALTDVPLSTRAAAAATLLIVPFAWAVAMDAARRLGGGGGLNETDRRLGRALVVYGGVVLIAGNVAVQAYTTPPAVRRPSTWRQLEKAGRLSFRNLTVKVSDDMDGFTPALVMYYLPGRRADVIGRGISMESLPLENVSKEQPLFLHNFDCLGVGHTDTVAVKGVGCLLLAPPSMVLDTSYPFNQTFLFITFDGMTPREPGGRWNTGSPLHLRAIVDPHRTPVDGDLFINVLVEPFLPPDVTPQRLGFRWGGDKRGETLIDQRRWFSLPVRSGDWSGNRLSAVPIAIDFPDGRKMLFQEISLSGSPRGTTVAEDNVKPPHRGAARG